MTWTESFYSILIPGLIAVWITSPPWHRLVCVAMSGAICILDIANHDWFAVVWGSIAVWQAWKFWDDTRGQRKKAAKLIGDKARLIRAALVRTMRDRAKPRPGRLAPQPG